MAREIVWSKDEWFVPNPLIEDLAVRLWRLFDERRQLIAPKLRRSGNGQAPYFYRAAEVGVELGLTPESYVEAALQKMSELGVYFPSLLPSIYVSATAKAEVDSLQERLAANYVSQINILRSRIQLYGLRHALEDRANGFTALMIYFSAKTHGLDDIAEQVRAAAKAEYERYPAQKQIWGEVEF